MSSERDVQATRLAPDRALPELTDGAARVLLRILRKAHDKQLTEHGNRDSTAHERDVA